MLDEIILHQAIKGVDRDNNADFTCAHLLVLIARNCHSIVLNQFLRTRYLAHIGKLKGVKSGALQPLFVLNNLVLNSQKAVWQFENPPGLPSGCRIPSEDVDVVRAALISHPVFVTDDEDLKVAIDNCEALHLRAMFPPEALLLAGEKC